MKHLTLVRHAKAEHGAAAQLDFDRALTGRGLRDAEAMAGRTLATIAAPTLIITSPAARALATARVFADACNYAPERMVYDGRIYEAPASRLLEVLLAHGGRAAHVMMFGHNPGIAEFAARLTDEGALRDQPTCAVMSLEAPVADWTALAWGSARLSHHDWPGR